MLASFWIMPALFQNHVLSPHLIYHLHLCTKNNKSMHYSTLHRTEGRKKLTLIFSFFIHISKPYMMVFFDPGHVLQQTVKKEPKTVKGYQIENKISIISFESAYQLHYNWKIHIYLENMKGPTQTLNFLSPCRHSSDSMGVRSNKSYRNQKMV